MKITAGIMIVLALLIGIVPQFTDCESQGRQLTLENGRQIPMKCHWTARGEIAVATPLFLTGSLLAFTKRRDSLRNLSALGGVLGFFSILLPTELIGVCGNPDMICNSTMKPTLIFLGSVVVGLGILGVIRAQRMPKELP